MIESIGKTIQLHRKMNHMTQAELAQRMSENGCPIKNAAISTWESDGSTPNAYKFLTLCQILGITDIYETFINPIPLRLVKVSAGTGEYVDDDSYEIINTINPEADYALRISGDSMENEYCDGDIVLVRKTDCLENGDIGIFYVNGEQYCKKLDRNRLISLNPKYKPIMLENVDCFRILGKVVEKL